MLNRCSTRVGARNPPISSRAAILGARTTLRGSSDAPARTQKAEQLEPQDHKIAGEPPASHGSRLLRDGSRQNSIACCKQQFVWLFRSVLPGNVGTFSHLALKHRIFSSALDTNKMSFFRTFHGKWRHSAVTLRCDSLPVVFFIHLVAQIGRAHV